MHKLWSLEGSQGHVDQDKFNKNHTIRGSGVDVDVGLREKQADNQLLLVVDGNVQWSHAMDIGWIDIRLAVNQLCRNGNRASLGCQVQSIVDDDVMKSV